MEFGRYTAPIAQTTSMQTSCGKIYQTCIASCKHLSIYIVLLNRSFCECLSS